MAMPGHVVLANSPVVPWLDHGTHAVTFPKPRIGSGVKQRPGLPDQVRQ